MSSASWAGECDARTFAELLFDESGRVVELRALEVRGVRGKGTVSGYFNSADKLIADAARLDRRGARGIYVTANPVQPALLARANNRTIDGVERATADTQILRLRWLLVDCDPARPGDVSGISATDEERAAAFAVLRAALEWLSGLGFSEPLKADAGNSGHALYRIDLPTEDSELLRRVLEALDARFSTCTAKIDTGNYTPARIWKFYGTVAAKGDATDDRPHRRSRLLHVPETLTVVPRELLELVAASAPQKESPSSAPRGSNGRYHGPPFDARAYLASHGVEIAREHEIAGGSRKLHLAACVWDATHTDDSAYVIVRADGALAAGCHHDSCARRAWRELRETLEPERSSTRHLPRSEREPASRGSLVRIAEAAEPPETVGRDAAKEPAPQTRQRIEWHTPGGDEPLHRLIPPAVEALSRVYRETLFVRGCELVRVVREDAIVFSEAGGIKRGGAPRIGPMPDPSLRVALDRSLEWIRMTLDRKGNEIEHETWAPRDVVHAIRDLGEWPTLRPLVGVVGAPTMRPDGTVLDAPGYDEATALIYAPAVEYPRVPESPSEDDVRSAWDAMLDPWKQFPFETPADRASHAAYLLTIAARAAINGSVPAWVYLAPSARTGKTLLAQYSVVAVTGSLPDTLAPVGSRQFDADREMRLRITSLVREATAVALVDNLPDASTFESPALAAALTSPTWTDRVLGTPQRASLPHRIVWAVSGNNISLAEDLAGRSLSIRLDARMEDPGLGRTFEIEDLPTYVRREHPRLLVAALTVLRGFVLAGRPGYGRPALGGFGSWDALVRGAVIWVVGIDPLDTQTRLRRAAPDKAALGALLQELAAAVPLGAIWKVRDLKARATEGSELQETLLAVAAGKDGRLSPERLGHKLRAAVGRPVGGLVLESAGNTPGVAEYRLVTVGSARPPVEPTGFAGISGFVHPARGSDHARTRTRAHEDGSKEPCNPCKPSGPAATDDADRWEVIT